ncbi:MAG: dTDP-4-dehydrorhamnose reductase [Leptolyngbya sp.]|nr:dTDP-4-dehydrorhamnose reductase [Leptolyngbya sp.]
MKGPQVLILGAQGQLGQALIHQLEPMMPTVALGRAALDLTQGDRILPLVSQYQPTVIVNAAAYTAVDRAETEADLAHQVNATAPGLLAEAAAAVGARLIHISTDYVFDGHRSRPWPEDAPTAPLSVYGRSKLAGEVAVRSHLPDHHLILRTAWVYGAQGPGNFVKTMVRLARERPELRVVADQIGTPTWTGDLAAAIARLIQLDAAVPPGTYHYTNSGVASWYDFAVAIVEESRALGAPFQVERVVPIPSEAYPTPVERPAYSVLDCRKLTALLGAPAPHWRQSLRTMLQHYLKEPS